MPKKWEEIDVAIRNAAVDWFKNSPQSGDASLWDKVATEEMKAEVEALRLGHLHKFFSSYELSMRVCQPRAEEAPIEPTSIQRLNDEADRLRRMRGYHVTVKAPPGIDQAAFDHIAALIAEAKYCPVPTSPSPIGWKPSTKKFLVDHKNPMVIYSWVPERAFVIEKTENISRIVYNGVPYLPDFCGMIPIVEKCSTVQFWALAYVTEIMIQGRELFDGSQKVKPPTPKR